MTNTTDTGLSRRKMMLVTGGAVAGAGALIAAPFRDEITDAARKVVASTPLGRGMLSLANAGYEEWLAQVGTVFSLGGSSRATLVGVRAFPSGNTPRAQGMRSPGFAAFFDLPARQSIAPDLIYTAVHPQYGPLPLYLSAAADRRTPNRMVAVFG